MLPTFPERLSYLHKSDCIMMECHELLKTCEAVEITVTKEMSNAIKEETRNQANSKLWYKYRAGRITASKMKAACCTKSAYSTQNPMKSICYPHACSHSVPQVNKLNGDVSRRRQHKSFTTNQKSKSVPIFK